MQWTGCTDIQYTDMYVCMYVCIAQSSWLRVFGDCEGRKRENLDKRARLVSLRDSLRPGELELGTSALELVLYRSPSNMYI